MRRGQRYFTCHACENDILVTKMTQHYNSQCQTIQYKKIESMYRKQNSGQSGSSEDSSEEKLKQPSEEKLKQPSEEKLKQRFQADFKDKVSLKQPQIPNKDYLFNKESSKIYNKPFIKQTTSLIKKYQQQKKNDFSGWQNFHKNAINSKYIQKNMNKGIKYLQKSILPKKSQKLKAQALHKLQLQQNRVQCVKCKRMIPFQNIDKHEFECSFQIQCQYCGQVTFVLNIQEHQKNCIIKKQLLKQQRGQYKYRQKFDHQPYYHQPQQENQYANDESYEDLFDIHHHLEQDENDQQAQWQYYSGYSNPISQHKYKGLTKSKLNSLPLMCYKKKSHKSQIKMLQSKQNQQKFSVSQESQKQSGLQKQQKQQDQQQQVCSICYLNFQQNQTIMKLKCLHYFHPQCVGKWFQSDDRCPLCKKNAI